MPGAESGATTEVTFGFDALYQGVTLETGQEYHVTGAALGFIHAFFTTPGLTLVTEGELSWKKDGAEVTGADLGEGAVLPERLGDDGVLLALDLPLGRYEVTLSAPGPAFAPVELPWVSNRWRKETGFHVQRLRLAEPEEHPTESDEPPEEEELTGVIHAALVLPSGALLTGATLEWTFNGRSAADRLPAGATLPEQVGDDGVILAEGLPPGCYEVRAVIEGSGGAEGEGGATSSGGGAGAADEGGGEGEAAPPPPRYRRVRLPWQREQGETPHHQRVKEA